MVLQTVEEINVEKKKIMKVLISQPFKEYFPP